MYECESCGCRFISPEPHREAREFWGRESYETVYGCPRCGAGYIETEGEPDESDLFY